MIPRVVRRGEVGGYVVVGAKTLSDTTKQEALDLVGIGPGLPVDEALPEDVLASGQGVGPLLGEDPPQPVGEEVVRRTGHHVGGGALQHRDVGRPFGHGRHEGHGRCPGPNDQDTLARVVEVLGPGLGVHNLTAEPVSTRECWKVTLAVAVVAGAHEQKSTSQRCGLAGGGKCGGDRPTGRVARPLGP